MFVVIKKAPGDDIYKNPGEVPDFYIEVRQLQPSVHSGWGEEVGSVSAFCRFGFSVSDRAVFSADYSLLC